MKFEGYNEKSKGGVHLVHFSILNWLHMFLIFNVSCSPFILELTIHFFIFEWFSITKQISASIHYITNLACDRLIMKIMWSSFIHRFVYSTHKYHALKTHLNIWINVLIDEVIIYKWTNAKQIFHFSINLCQMYF